MRDLPLKAFFVADVPPEMHAMPFIVRWQCVRLAAENKVQPHQVVPHTAYDYASFWAEVEQNPACPKQSHPLRESRDTWVSLDGHSLKARMLLNRNTTEPVFSLQLLPIQRETSCRLQRAFGSDRFLYVSMPAPSVLESCPRSVGGALKEKVLQWLLTEHHFLGRTWRAFHLEDAKLKKTPSADYEQRVVFFATDGCDLTTRGERRDCACSVGDMIDWFMPLKANRSQKFCKAFARPDLGLFRTVAAGPLRRPIPTSGSKSPTARTSSSRTRKTPTRCSGPWSSAATARTRRPANLGLSFVPILVDRGVPVSTLECKLVQDLNYARNELLEALPDIRKLRKWISNQADRREERFRTRPPPDVGLPDSTCEALILLLEAGFTPTGSRFVADRLQSFLEGEHAWQLGRCAVPVPKAMYLYGIPDPEAVLAPGEVQVRLSSAFVAQHMSDASFGESFFDLDGMCVLVARNPACRPSDVQKVRATVKRELAHLVDVVVFPSKGQVPLAKKLQGGDYDGDTF